MEGGVLQTQLINHGVHSFDRSLRHYNGTPVLPLRTVAITNYTSYSVNYGLPKMARHNKYHQICAVRRRRSNIPTDTYVLLEPGKNEEFVSGDELKARLKTWLENWPGNGLPPDLARFKTIDDAVSHLVRSVCELELDGEVGSIQWYEVRLESNP